jgi:glyoxylase-like metal-dependent hydrolase (beta-lactamase superfamily II)
MADDDITFDRDFSAPPDQPEWVAANVRRVLAPNSGPFTFTGTCTYIVGNGEVAIIDPGPDDAGHLKAVLDAVRGESVAHILVTHSHIDHSPGAAAMKAATGAKVFAEGPHRPSRPVRKGEERILEAGADRAFSPDVRLQDGEAVEGKGYALEAVFTPGHAANHLAFVLKGTNILFSGDHVMGWSTSIVAPPEGSMRDYVASLHKLKARGETRYFPGHGPEVADAPPYVDRLIAHRMARENAILRRLEGGEADVEAIVRAIYLGLDPRLDKAAALTTFAHLEDLIARGRVATEGAPALAGRFRLP